MNTKHARRLGVALALSVALAGPTVGIAFAQEGSPAGETTQVQTQDDGNDFPWGLLGLLGLGGLAGLRRREEPRRVDTSRTSHTSH
jgi:MYXO-CTERM domain-containing protein